MKESLENIAPLFDGTEAMLHAFKKDSYAGCFQEYMEKHRMFFSDLNWALAAEEDADFIPDFAGTLLAFVEARLAETEGKVRRENLQLNLNMFMATYFLPAVLESRQAGAQALTDSICTGWAEHFPGNNIKGADFETICSGFKPRQCYITTAVCRSLHKPEDCYELELLRGYRDNCLLGTEEGEALVQRYYDVAPTIVKRIDRSADAEEKYRYIWETYLQPCISCIENKQPEACRSTYVKMVEELQQEYIVTADKGKKQQMIGTLDRPETEQQTGTLDRPETAGTERLAQEGYDE